MKFWITKDALTQGIYEVPGSICDEIKNTISTHEVTLGTSYYYGDEWHTTKEEAIEYAHKMRWIEIDRLQTRLDELIKMSFDI